MIVIVVNMRHLVTRFLTSVKIITSESRWYHIESPGVRQVVTVVASVGMGNSCPANGVTA